MKQARRYLMLLLTVGALSVVFASPLLATESEETPEPAPVSEDTPEPSGLEPAVPIPDEGAAETVPDWTYRYVVPTGLALVVVVVLITSIRYFTNVVRKRYRIVEE